MGFGIFMQEILSKGLRRGNCDITATVFFKFQQTNEALFSKLGIKGPDAFIDSFVSTSRII